MFIDFRVGVSVISECKKVILRVKFFIVKKGVFLFCLKIVNWESLMLSKNGLMLMLLSLICLFNMFVVMLGSFVFSIVGMIVFRIMV